MSYRSTILADNPKGYWRLEELQRTAVDASANHNAAAVASGVTTGVVGPSGDGSKAMTFDGNSAHVVKSWPYNPSTLSGTFTVEYWVKQGWTGYACGSRSPNEHGCDFGVGHADIGDGSAWLTTTANPTMTLVSGWNHVVWVITPSGWTAYLNGASAGSGSFSGTPLFWDTNHTLWLGYNGTDTAGNGSLAEFAVYNTALSSGRVSAHYAAISGTSYAATVLADSPVLYLRLGDTTFGSTTVNDETTNANNGSATGLLGRIAGADISDPPEYGVGPTSKSGDYVTITPTTPASITGTWSVELWVANGTQGEVFGTRAPTDYGSDINISTTQVHGDIGNGVNGYYTTAANTTGGFSWPSQPWHQVVYVVTPTSWKVYINGALQNSGTFASGTPMLYDSSHHIYILWNGIVTDPHTQGAVDEVSIYDYALTATQVSAHYIAALTPPNVTPQVSGASDIVCEAELNWLRGLSFPSAPATIYVGLYSAVPDGSNAGGTELSGNNYGRAALDKTKWSTPIQSGTMQIGPGQPWWISYLADIDFPTPSANWPAVGWFGFFDASSAGNLLAFGSFANFISFTAGNPAVIANTSGNGSLVVLDGGSLAALSSASSHGDYLAQARLNYLRGIAYPAAPSTIYAALYTSLPNGSNGSGAECAGVGYTRQAIPADTVHLTQPFGGGNASAPWSSSNVSKIDWGLPQNNIAWGPFAALALLDAASSGNLLMYGQATGSIAGAPGGEVLVNAGGLVISSR